MSRHLSGLTLGVLSLLNDKHNFAATEPYYPEQNEDFNPNSSISSLSLPDNKGNNFGSKRTPPPLLETKRSSAPDPESKSSVCGKTRRNTPKPGLSTMVAGGTCSEGHVDLEVKIILLGDYSVGKSSLLRVLARHSGHFDDRDDSGSSMVNASTRSSTSLRIGKLAYVDQGSRGSLVRSGLQPGGFVEVEFTHQEKTVLARIADTGGQERYRSMTTSYYRGAHGCLLMFDVTKEESFANLDLWIENIDCYKSSDEFACILVGTRCNSPARRILYDRAAEFAESRGLPYMELDMEYMSDVRRVFEALLDSVTVNLNKCAPVTISIRPEISNKTVRVRKSVACSC